MRDLYRRVLHIGPYYPHPEGMHFVRRKAKEMFRENADVSDEVRCSQPRPVRRAAPPRLARAPRCRAGRGGAYGFRRLPTTITRLAESRL